MPNFAQRQKQTQNSHLISPVKPDRAMPQPAYAENPLLAQQQAMGNQAAQRFAQSCPLALPGPSVCPFGGVCHTCPARVQAKLAINEPGDKYEQEADRVAEQIMHMPEPYTREEAAVPEQPQGVHIQRACLECDEDLRRQPLDEEEEEEILRVKEVPGHTPQVTPDLADQIDSLQGRGQPLPVNTRAFFESRFGYDFGRVHIHADGRAAELARGVEARAFTLGRNVVFGAGEYAPETVGGKRLLAHELVHVIQQSRVNGHHQMVVQRHECEHSRVNRCPPARVRSRVVPAFQRAHTWLTNASPRVGTYIRAPHNSSNRSVADALWNHFAWDENVRTQQLTYPDIPRMVKRVIDTLIPVVPRSANDVHAFCPASSVQLRDARETVANSPGGWRHTNCYEFFAPFFEPDRSLPSRAKTAVHEMSHSWADTGDEYYEWEEAYHTMGIRDSANNADSYAALVRDVGT